ncbi:hypothetical protein BaRGS_00002352 [Batillaria attramentaria]|uniref:Uncharacterized protein n=1 Tax=Batillaria attramentaria TaxID=370345 RepID=A0ABD0M2V8_9CAEN
MDGEKFPSTILIFDSPGSSLPRSCILARDLKSATLPFFAASVRKNRFSVRLIFYLPQRYRKLAGSTVPLPQRTNGFMSRHLGLERFFPHRNRTYGFSALLSSLSTGCHHHDARIFQSSSELLTTLDKQPGHRVWKPRHAKIKQN